MGEPARKVTADAAGPPVRLPVEAPDDAQLVARALIGDRWAHESLYRRHVQAAGHVALRVLRHRADAEDAVHDAFVMAFERLTQLADPSLFRAWVLRITFSRAHRRLRWRRWAPWSRTAENAPSIDELVSHAADAETLSALRQLDAALSRAPRDVRDAWWLRHAMKLTNEEIAVALGCSLATAKRRVAAADAHLALSVGGGVE